MQNTIPKYLGCIATQELLTTVYLFKNVDIGTLRAVTVGVKATTTSWINHDIGKFINPIALCLNKCYLGNLSS